MLIELLKLLTVTLITTQFIFASTCSEFDAFISQKKYKEIQIKNTLTSLHFSEVDSQKILESSKQLSPEVNIQEIILYLRYLKSLPEKNFSLAFQDFKLLGHPENVTSSSIKTYKKEKIKAQMLYPLFKAGHTLQEFEHLYMNCQSRDLNANNQAANALFAKYGIPVNLGFIGGVYGFYHGFSHIDSRWLWELLYDESFALINVYAGIKIQVDRRASNLKRSLGLILAGRAAGIYDMLVYPTFFSPYQDKAEKRLEELKQNPEFQKDVEKLLSNYNEKSIYLRFKTQNTEFISKLILKKEPIILGGEDFSHLTLKDLEREEIKDQLARAAIREAYGLGTEKNMISTGTVGTDRFLSGGLLQLSFIPLMLLRNNGSYQIMCLGNKTPIRTFIISSLWTVGFNSLLQEVYYLFRKYTINQ